MTFTLGTPSIKLEVPNDEHVTNIRVSSTSKTLKKRRARKGTKTKKFQTEGSKVNDPNTMGMAQRLLPIQIMIGSIPITLGTTESVMMTSIEEMEARHPETSNVKVTKKSIKISKMASQKQKATPQPKAMRPRILELTSPKIDPVVKGKEVAMDIDALFETLPPTKQGPRKNTRREESQTSELFDYYPLTALCVEQSKRAKSNLEVQKWVFFSGYLLAKEENFGLETSSKHKNVTEICEEINESPRPYSSPITHSRAHAMSQSIIDDSSISTTSSDTMETQSDFHSPPYRDSESIFQEEDFPGILINQFGKVLKISDESDSEDMPVLVTSTTNLEEQLQELQRKLTEKDAEIAALAAQVASQANSSSRVPVVASNSISLLEGEPKSTLPCSLGAKPNNVEKIKKTLDVKVESSNLPSLYELMTEAKLDFWENSSKDGNEEWQTYIVEYLPKEFLQNHSEDEMKEEVVQCCTVSVDDNEREVDKVTLLSGQHLSLPQKEKLSQNAKDDVSKGKEGNS
nr:hypothetical protein CFP56_10921 [Quercus suber]